MQYFNNVATLKLNPQLCNGCTMCTQVCPHAVFEMVNKRAQIIDVDDCMECGACVLNCQAGALSVNSGVGCASAIINGILTNSEPSCDCSGGSTKNEASCC